MFWSRWQKRRRLRNRRVGVVVSLSEKYAADIVNGAKVEFTVPALAQWGRASRIGDVSRSLVARSALRSDAFLFGPRPWRARRKPRSSYASGMEVPNG